MIIFVIKTYSSIRSIDFITAIFNEFIRRDCLGLIDIANFS